MKVFIVSFLNVCQYGKFTAGLMSLRLKEEIGEKTHTLDQFIPVEAVSGVAVLVGVEHQISDGTAVVIPTGTRHNIIDNSDRDELKLYTLYSPPEGINDGLWLCALG